MSQSLGQNFRPGRNVHQIMKRRVFAEIRFWEVFKVRHWNPSTSFRPGLSWGTLGGNSLLGFGGFEGDSSGD